MREIAAVIMSYNEASVIERALQSVREWAEVHVSIDSASADAPQVVKLVEQYGGKVYYHKGLPHPAPEQDDADATKAVNSYARMRNEVFEAVGRATRAPWFLWLDADEYVEAGVEVLLAGMDRLTDDIQAVAVRMRLLNPDGTPNSTILQSKLCRRTMRFTRRRHEHLMFTGPQAQCTDTVITHLPVQPDPVRKQHDDRKQAQQPFLDDWREFRDGRAAFYMGVWWAQQTEEQTALAWFERGLVLPDDLCPPHQRTLLALYAAKMHIANNEYPQARLRCMEAITADWRNGEAVNLLGAIAANTGQADEARHWWQIALGMPDETQCQAQIAVGSTTDLPYYGLAALACAEGDRNEAYRLLLEAERRQPVSRPAYVSLRQKLDEVA